VLERVDNDGWRRGLREALAAKDEDKRKALLQVLVKAPEATTQPPVVLAGLGRALFDGPLEEEARVLLVEAQQRHFDDFWINFQLGRSLTYRGCQEAVVYLRVAVAIRPENAEAHNSLGTALFASGDLTGAIAAFRKARALNPKIAVPIELTKILDSRGGLADIPKMDAQSQVGWSYSVGVQAYVFGLPLTIFERERNIRLDPVALEKAKKVAPAAPINQLGHMKNLATADDVLPYTPNNDTVDSGAILELVDEPVILTVPEILDRYWSVQVADCYTENLFYIGTRATGGKSGNHAFVGPNWQGKLPVGLIEHRVPYNSLMIALRIGVIPGDDADLKNVLGLQEQFALTSLSNWGDTKKFGMAGVPKLRQRPNYQGDLAFYQTVANLLAENPPTKQHEAAIVLLSRAGIVVGQPFDPAKLEQPMRDALVRAAQDGPQIMKWKVKYRGTPYPTRWNNLRPGDYGVDYFDRAAGALEGLFVHDREEAMYFSTYEDGDAKLLEGANKYVLHFNKDEIPQTLKNGFWSFTMYGTNFQLVKNSINRFSIGDRTKGLVYNKDGSLDIYVQNQAPDGKGSNWLPCPPSGLFRINYRIYLPVEAARNPATLSKYLPSLKVRG
jgi:hypothetical protein